MAHPTLTHILTTVFSLMAGLAVIAVRFKSAKKPTSFKKIVMPPIGMATGFWMFLLPIMRIPWTWGAAMFLVGAIVFAYPLIRTSKFEVVDGDIYLQRSKSFIIIIFSLLLIRIVMHDYLEAYVTIPQTGGLFFLLAFGMLLPWRLMMLRDYKRILKQMEEAEINR